MYIKSDGQEKEEAKEMIKGRENNPGEDVPNFLWDILYGCSPSGGPFITHDLAARLKTRLLDISSYYIF